MTAIFDAVSPVNNLDRFYLKQVGDFVRSEMEAEVESRKDLVSENPFWLLRRMDDVPFVDFGTFNTGVNRVTVIIPDDAGTLKRDYQFFEGHVVAVKKKESGEVYEGVVQNLSGTSQSIRIGEAETIPYDARIQLREADDDDLAVAGLLHPIKYQRELEAISDIGLGPCLDARERRSIA